MINEKTRKGMDLANKQNSKTHVPTLNGTNNIVWRSVQMTYCEQHDIISAKQNWFMPD